MKVVTEVVPVLVQDRPRIFPIWWYGAEWYYKGEAKEHDRVREDGLILNSTGVSIGFRKDPKEDDLIRWGKQVIKQQREKGVEPVDVSLNRHLKYRAEWWLLWFAHSTFDDGQTDKEALDSFQEYVWWAQRQGKKRTVGVEHNVVELMGAEDRWRWCGSKDGRAGMMWVQNPTDPPCRCSGCKKNGVIRICH